MTTREIRASGARRTIWVSDDGWSVAVIDQTRLPHVYAARELKSLADAAAAIETMTVRGAPLIGATAGYGMALAMRENSSDAGVGRAVDTLTVTRPTAVNLRWALEGMRQLLLRTPEAERVAAAYRRAGEICEEDVAINRSIGEHGLPLIRAIAESRPGPVNILTHCNAGWLATVGWGTATAPVYRAAEEGIPVHVWVEETRPRNQGAALTAWELTDAKVPHTVIVDNAGGHMMQRGAVDLCIVGTDRTAANGDVANKIGTYLKALAAHDNEVPFYVGLPSPTIDWSLHDGREIPIEDRGPREITHISGMLEDGGVATVRLTPETSPAANPAFDVTPARYVTGLITERGVCAASTDGLLALFPERRPNR